LAAPTLTQNADEIRLAGVWTLVSLMASAPDGDRFRLALKKAETVTRWNLLDMERLDSAAAVLLWQSWGYRWPAGLQAPLTVRATLERVADIFPEPSSSPRLMPSRDAASSIQHFVLTVGRLTLTLLRNLMGIIELYGRLVLDAL
jgi:phospholipid/cholesterol/gamma-HCH transport system permease protein